MHVELDSWQRICSGSGFLRLHLQWCSIVSSYEQLLGPMPYTPMSLSCMGGRSVDTLTAKRQAARPASPPEGSACHAKEHRAEWTWAACLPYAVMTMVNNMHVHAYL